MQAEPQYFPSYEAFLKYQDTYVGFFGQMAKDVGPIGRAVGRLTGIYIIVALLITISTNVIEFVTPYLTGV